MMSLYSTINIAVLPHNNTGGCFKTTVGVRQGYLLSPVLFSLYLENIMRETLHNFKSSVSIAGRTISNLRLADDIDLMGESNNELQMQALKADCQIVHKRIMARRAAAKKQKSWSILVRTLQYRLT